MTDIDGNDKHTLAHSHITVTQEREPAVRVHAGAATLALIINQWANCKCVQSASLAHMTSLTHVSLGRV